MSAAAAGKGLGERWASRLVCSKTGEGADLDLPAFLSPAGAPWLVEYDLDPALGADFKAALAHRPWSLWRYRELLPLANFDERVDLGEGGTPLVRLRRAAPAGVEVWLKEESGNPTGSFKARGLTMAINRARELGAAGVQLASAGNAALAMAAYAAAAGLACRVAVPVDAPRTIIDRCRLYGAEVIVAGNNLAEAGLELAGRSGDFWELSTLKEPYRAEGKKTMGLELVEQFDWSLPEWILYPTGGGTGIVGMQKAFDELEALGLLSGPRPRFVAVQMNGCAPIVRAFEQGLAAAPPWESPETSVWGLRVPRAIGDFLILRSLRDSGGTAVSVDEEEVCREQALLSREAGLLVGPEGAAAMLALRTLVESGCVAQGERAVVFQTGHPGNYV
jgi:threonine synthase